MMKNNQIGLIGILLFILCFPTKGISQDESWGIGTLSAYYKSHTLTVYNAPNGTIKGSLSVDDRGEIAYWEDGPRLIVDGDAKLQVNIDEFRLKVFKEEEDFIQIFSNDSTDQAWLSLVEIAKTVYYYVPWIDFMSTPSQDFFAQSFGMNLRSEPSASGELITTAKGMNFTIIPTGSTNGLWAEVIVMEYDAEYCEENRKLIKESRGYMKILDDKGYPNVWFGGYCS